MSGRVGPRTFQLLMSRFDTVDDILLAETKELERIDGIDSVRSEAISGGHEMLDEAQRQINLLEASNIRAVTSLDHDYPEALREINDPPPLLYYQGRLPAHDEKRAAVIGSQEVSNEGMADTVELAKRLAGARISIVGGLDRGIDAAGHTGALKAKGVSYAVLGSGINQIYPPENAGLAREITVKGGLISEYLPDTPPDPARQLDRNRLIIGLSQAVIIGEVSDDSVGTLDAALGCHQLGKLLFVVIGKYNPHYNKLAKYGAIPLTHVDQYEMVIKALV